MALLSCDLLISGGTLVLADALFPADIAILGEKILAVLPPGAPVLAQERIDAGGRKIIPGLMDAHMHVQAPFQGVTGALTFYEQSICAAFGGVTSFFDFTNTWKGSSLREALQARQADMSESAIDYGIHGKIVEATPEILAEIPLLLEAGCPSFKLFMTYRKEGVMTNDEMLLKVFGKASTLPLLPMIHAESNPIAEYLFDQKIKAGKTSWRDFCDTKPKGCETEAFFRAVQFAIAAKSPLLVVHTTHGDCLDIAKWAQSRGYPIYIETCPQYLTLTDDLYDDISRGHLAMCSPPLRGRDDAKALWKGLKEGTISLTGSDDCTFRRAEKERFLEKDEKGGLIPDFRKVVNGVSGLETRLPLLLSGVARGDISFQQLVAITSTNVARLMGCYPQKGTIAKGSDADLVILDETPWEIAQSALHNGADVSLYEGMRVAGRAWMTFSRGKAILSNGRFLGKKGAGRYLHRTLDPALLRRFALPA